MVADGFQRHPYVFARQAGALHGYTSNLSASIGSSRAALRVGYTPKKTPTALETTIARITAESGTDMGNGVNRPTAKAIPAASSTPSTPPMADITEDSMTN